MKNILPFEKRSSSSIAILTLYQGLVAAGLPRSSKRLR